MELFARRWRRPAAQGADGDPEEEPTAGAVRLTEVRALVGPARLSPAVADDRLLAVLITRPTDFAPYGYRERTGVNCARGCRWFVTLDEPFAADWGVCATAASPRAGLLTWEHQGCPAFEPDPACAVVAEAVADHRSPDAVGERPLAPPPPRADVVARLVDRLTDRFAPEPHRLVELARDPESVDLLLALDRAVQAAGNRVEALRAVRFAGVSDLIIRRHAGRPRITGAFCDHGGPIAR